MHLPRPEGRRRACQALSMLRPSAIYVRSPFSPVVDTQRTCGQLQRPCAIQTDIALFAQPAHF